jgi:hypothetical protein
MGVVKSRGVAEESLAGVVAAGKAVNVAELAEELIQAFGGARKFAARYYHEYRAAKAGTISRSRMLEGVLRTISISSAQTKAAQRDEGSLTDSELATAALDLLSRTGLTQPTVEGGGTGDGEA